MTSGDMIHRYMPVDWNPGQFGVVLDDPSGIRIYKPAIDHNDDEFMDSKMEEIVEQHILDPVKLAEEMRWAKLANQREMDEIESKALRDRIDADQNLRNDEIERQQKALFCYNYMKDDVAKVIAICELMEVINYDGLDISVLRMAIYDRINSDMRDRRGRKFQDLFIEVMTMEMENDAKPKPKPINVRFAHMVDEFTRLNVSKDFEKAHGKDWAKKAHEYAKYWKRDFHLLDEYSSTILDDNTILVFPRNYKKPIEAEEPLWTEDDFVPSQSYFATQNETTTHRRGILDRFFR